MRSFKQMTGLTIQTVNNSNKIVSDAKFWVEIHPNPNMLAIHTWAKFNCVAPIYWSGSTLEEREEAPENLQELATKLLETTELSEIFCIKKQNIVVKKSPPVGYKGGLEDQLGAILPGIINLIADYQGIADNEAERRFIVFREVAK